MTSGYHFHHVAADQEEILDEIEAALREKDFWRTSCHTSRKRWKKMGGKVKRNEFLKLF